jgi:hypothetical protein
VDSELPFSARSILLSVFLLVWKKVGVFVLRRF